MLRRTLDPVVRFRLLRDVLERESGETDRTEARAALETSCWVRQLAHDQWEDGSWGRLHTQASSATQRIPTTEAGVARALALGLDAEHPILRRSSSYLTGVLRGRIQCRDRPEKNELWHTCVELFAAATLASVDAALSALDGPWAFWRDVARRTFVSGSYDPMAEARAHQAATGATVSGSYLEIDNKYSLGLLVARSEQRNPALEQALVGCVWHKSDGIGHLRENLSNHPTLRRPVQ